MHADPPAAPRDLEVLEARPLNAETPLAALGEPTPGGPHYVRNHFDVPDLDPASWRLAVGGAVGREITLTLDDLKELPHRSITATLECAGNGRTLMSPPPSGTPWTLGAVGTATWTGAPVAALLERVGPDADVTDILFVGADEGEVAPGRTEAYARSLPRAAATDDGPLLAWAMNGRPLPPEHGRPLRLVVPGWYGMASVKWLVRVAALTEPFEGFYQAEDYVYRGEEGTPDGTPVTRARVRALIASPRRGERLAGGEILVRGSAWSGHGQVTRVEVSEDAGRTWDDAELGEAASPHAAVPWRYRWRPDGTGRFTLVARATDDAGHTQPLEPRWNDGGYGNNSVHQITVEVR